jgi:hypothetical protein
MPSRLRIWNVGLTPMRMPLEPDDSTVGTGERLYQ